MTKEDKELLLKDLCARLPYRVKAQYYDEEEQCETWDVIEGVSVDTYDQTVDIGQYSLYIGKIKPYLFPLSSMTEEQKRELLSLAKYEQICEESCGFDSRGIYINIVGEYEYENNQESITLYIDDIGIDWCNKNHFDYRGLIEKGLAIDATGLNIYE